MLLLGPYYFCAVLCPSLHEMFLWYLQFSLRDFCCCCYVTSVMSDSVKPHRQKPTRLSHPWDSPGKNTGVGCHFLLECVKVKSESEVAQSCPTLSDPSWTVAHQAPPPMGFSRQEYWSGVPLPSPNSLEAFVVIMLLLWHSIVHSILSLILSLSFAKGFI